jgi:hypothetical protein
MSTCHSARAPFLDPPTRTCPPTARCRSPHRLGRTSRPVQEMVLPDLFSQHCKTVQRSFQSRGGSIPRASSHSWSASATTTERERCVGVATSTSGTSSQPGSLQVNTVYRSSERHSENVTSTGSPPACDLNRSGVPGSASGLATGAYPPSMQRTYLRSEGV